MIRTAETKNGFFESIAANSTRNPKNIERADGFESQYFGKALYSLKIENMNTEIVTVDVAGVSGAESNIVKKLTGNSAEIDENEVFEFDPENANTSIADIIFEHGKDFGLDLGVDIKAAAVENIERILYAVSEKLNLDIDTQLPIVLFGAEEISEEAVWQLAELLAVFKEMGNAFLNAGLKGEKSENHKGEVILPQEALATGQYLLQEAVKLELCVAELGITEEVAQIMAANNPEIEANTGINIASDLNTRTPAQQILPKTIENILLPEENPNKNEILNIVEKLKNVLSGGENKIENTDTEVVGNKTTEVAGKIEVKIADNESAASKAAHANIVKNAPVIEALAELKKEIIKEMPKTEAKTTATITATITTATAPAATVAPVTPETKVVTPAIASDEVKISPAASEEAKKLPTEVKITAAATAPATENSEVAKTETPKMEVPKAEIPTSESPKTETAKPAAVTTNSAPATEVEVKIAVTGNKEVEISEGKEKEAKEVKETKERGVFTEILSGKSENKKGNQQNGENQKKENNASHNEIFSPIRDTHIRPTENGINAPITLDGISIEANKFSDAGEIHPVSPRFVKLFEKEIVEQVQRTILASANKNGLHEITLTLNPEKLGEIRITIQVENGVVSARLNVENTQVKSIVEQNLQSLRDALAQQNLSAGTLDVNVGDNTRELQEKIHNARNRHKANGFFGTEEGVMLEEALEFGVDTGRRFGTNSFEFFA